MEATAPVKPDKLWITGLILLLLSAILFFYPSVNPRAFVFDNFFVINYGIAILYLVILGFNDRLRRGNGGLPHIFLLLNMTLLSCFALNRGITIFQHPSPWWAVLLVISCINFTTLLFFHRLPPAARYSICFIMGISFAAFAYLVFYLTPVYLIGLLAFLFLGISLHVFVPLLFVLFMLVFIVRATRMDKRVLYFFFAGLLFSIVFATQYAIRWHSRINTIRTSLSSHASLATETDLPGWVAVAQALTGSDLDEAILKSDIVYTTAGDVTFDGWLPRASFDEKRKHDPLIVIATLFSGDVDLTQQDKINILLSLFDSRHKAERRLWSGDDCITTAVATDVQLWPQLHVSYTEENITVVNTVAEHDNWAPNEEALYTFHLPEGAVVSALSLWINGKEQKGILSSRQKADSAYRTIVGGESRDPSVVHWQEGNTVTVRVFPVTTESRRFKIGITAPLEKNGKKLAYHSIRFDGPSPDHAQSSVRILPMERLIQPEWPSSFQSDSTSHLRYPPSLLSITAATQAPIRQDGDYTPDWSLQCLDPGIETATFTFGGKQYSTGAYTPALGPGAFRQVYLDLNSSWTAEEYESLLSSLAAFPVYASLADDDLVSVTANNQKEIFAAGSKRQFSLFPFARITDYGHSLIISKSNPNSPNLSDLKGSPFAQRLEEWLENGGRVRLYNIGDELSPYLRTLRETGAFDYEKGDCYTLQNHLHHNTFPTNPLAANEVLIEPAGLLLRRIDAPADTAMIASKVIHPIEQTAPDHLFRLFAYRRILQQLKGRLPGSWSSDDLDTNTLQVQLAQQAGIVSPVSSYVVLEKEEDYTRFDIHHNMNSLQNASIQGKGAVPEPRDWAILLSVLALLAYIRYRRLQQQRRSTTSQ